MMKAILYEHALKKKPEEALQALRDEVNKAIKISIWDPVYLKELTQEQKNSSYL